MTIVPDESRSQSGWSYLRSRYVLRARHLVGNWSGSFRTRIEEERKAWNEAFPAYRIERTMQDVGWTPPPAKTFDRLLQPVGLGARTFSANELQGIWSWRERIHELCLEFWPPAYYVNPYHSESDHPAGPIVAASLLFDSRDLTDQHIESLIHPFRVMAHQAPYPIDQHIDPFSWERATIQRALLIDELAEHIDDDSVLQQIVDRITAQCWEMATEKFPLGPHPMDQKDLHLYVPILPGVSGNDIEKSAADLAAAARQMYGDRSVNDMIQGLSGEGQSQQAIADLLGIAKSTVIKARRS